MQVWSKLLAFVDKPAHSVVNLACRKSRDSPSLTPTPALSSLPAQEGGDQSRTVAYLDSAVSATSTSLYPPFFYSPKEE
jgi:hypothetical protein